MMNALQKLACAVLSRSDDDPAIRFEGHWHGWAEVRSLAAEVDGLIRLSGAHPRAAVLFLARNIPEMVATLLGLIGAGRTIRMLYSFQSQAVLAREIERLRPAVVVAAEQDLGDALRDATRACGAAVIALGKMAARALPGLERSTRGLDHDAPLEPVIEIQTSGTTGPPKRFPVSYTKAYRHFVERLVPADELAGTPAAFPAILFMSMGNLSGMMGTLPPLLLGRPMILCDRFNLEAWRDYIRAYRPVHGGLPPSAVQTLVDLETPPADLASLHSLVVGSAPLNPRAHRAFEARFGIPVLLAYGATEFYGTVAAMTAELYAEWKESKFGSVGRAIPGVALRTVDPASGALCQPGETGLIEVLSADIASDWLRTSDLGIIDEDGFLFIRGRADGAIIRGGFKLLPESIERVLLLHEAISSVAVVAVPDRRLGEVPAAAVEFGPGTQQPDQQQLEALVRQHLPATYVPVHWRFVTELPRTTSMKVDRGAAARLFEGVSAPAA